MLRVLLWLGQFVVVAPSVYETLVSLAGLRTPQPTSTTADPRRIRAVVPAHDEATVIEGISRDLADQQVSPHRLTSWVIADRCSDDTATIAARHVSVAERIEGAGGKGAALAWFLDEHPLDEDEILLVLDADNRIEASFVAGIAEVVDPRGGALQAYLDVANPDGSMLSLANALTYWASNRSVQLARTNLGWSADLGGTGMAVPAAALAAAGGFEDDLTDDLSLNIRLNLAGYRTGWLHHVRVRDEKPERTEVVVTQRARWVRGKREVRRIYLGRLVRTAFTQRRLDLLDLAIRLVNPGRSFLALGLVVLTGTAILAPGLGLWPAWVLGSVTVVVVALPLVFLAIDGVPRRYLIRYPYVAAIGVLWVPIRIAGRLVRGWRRTPHAG